MAVILHLYCTLAPRYTRGTFTALARQIFNVSGGRSGYLLAMGLSCGEHPPGYPASVEVIRPECVDGLVTLCSEYGITVERIADDEFPSRIPN